MTEVGESGYIKEGLSKEVIVEYRPELSAGIMLVNV